MREGRAIRQRYSRFSRPLQSAPAAPFVAASWFPHHFPTSLMRLALYEPDIPQNTGTLIRLAACFGVGLDIIEPCGFVLSDRRLRRAALDYLAAAQVTRHASWAAFQAAQEGRRLILLTSRGDLRYDRFVFAAEDVLLLGSESAGAPPAVHAAATARLRIPMRPGLRSLNQAVAGAIVLAEALRQTGLLEEG
jgi:tRNA (cytidine/uridine-2'-O-)-methyltransferase